MGRLAAATRYLALLAVALWLGAEVFFGAVLAPVAFTVLPSRHMAGLVVAVSLARLHYLGLGCGLLLLVLLLIAPWLARWNRLALGLTVVMLALTATSQFDIMPAMEKHRAAAPGGDISALPHSNPDWIAFDRLHRLSTDVEGGVLFCGLVLLTAFTAAPDAASRR